MAEEIMKDELAVEEAPAKKTRKTTKKAEGETATAKKATTKKATSKKAAAKPATVTITLKKSLIGALQAQKDCAAALGLKKVGDVKVHPENAATMGKVAKIAHLVAVTK